MATKNKSFNKFNLADAINKASKEVNQEIVPTGKYNIVEINTKDISSWTLRDRTKDEVGDIEKLSNSIKVNGQVQPIIVVKKTNEFISEEDCKYVLIAGYRRFLACSLLGIKVKAVLEELSFSDAIGVLLSENEKENVSDYSKGLFYAKVLHDDKISQQELCNKIGLDKSSFSNFIAFSMLPNELVKAVGVWYKVSSRTAGYLRSKCKNEDNLKIFIKNADLIRDGAGERTLARLLKSNKSKNNNLNSDDHIVLSEHLNISLKNKSINFPKKIIEHKEFDSFVQKLKNIIEESFLDS